LQELLNVFSRRVIDLDMPRYNEPRDIITQIYKTISYFNPALRRIADYILDNPEQCKTMTIKDLAESCEVAESTVTRFVKEIGLQNFQALKIGIAEALTRTSSAADTSEERHVYEDISQGDSIRDIMEKVLYRNIQTLTDTFNRLNLEAVEQAVAAIAEADSLILCSMGSSNVAAEEASVRFTRAGKKCLYFKDASMQLMTAAIITPRDVMIGISNSGRTTQVVSALKSAQISGARTIGITSFEDSPMVRYSDILLFTPTKLGPYETGLNWEVTTSKTAQILAIDVLYACFAVRTFDKTLKNLENTYQAAKDTRTK
jgi:RpiR family transcriptional regulator, carbohydrate utilization regulator